MSAHQDDMIDRDQFRHLSRIQERAGQAASGLRSPESVPAAKKPFAYIAFTGDVWNGCSAPEPEISFKWMIKLAAAGCTIKPVYTREEYDVEMAKLK